MARVFSLKTTLIFQIGASAEEEVGVTILYNVTPAHPQTLTDPGCDATAEISAIIVGGSDVPWLTNALDQDETLLADCLADWSEQMEAERDEAADRRREDLRERLMEYDADNWGCE